MAFQFADLSVEVLDQRQVGPHVLPHALFTEAFGDARAVGRIRMSMSSSPFLYPPHRGRQEDSGIAGGRKKASGMERVAADL